MPIRKISHILFNLISLVPFLFILSTVFVVNNYWANGIVAGKYSWFYQVIGFVPVATFLSYIFYRKKVLFSVADLIGGLFCLTGLIAAYFTESVVTNKLILFVLAGVLFFCFRIYFYQYRKAIFLLTIAFIFTGLVESIWGLAQLYQLIPSQHSLFIITGSFFNPGPYAGYVAMVLPLVFYYCLFDRRILSKKFDIRYLWFYIRGGISFITFFTGILILPVTFSRASWIASFVGCILVGFFYFVHHHKRYFIAWKQKYWKIIRIILIPFLLLLFITGIGLYNLKKDSADGRLLMWKVSAKTIIQHPLGVGIGNFSGSYGKAQADYFSSGKGTPKEEFIAGNPEYAFNEYLQICIEWGVIPFLFFISFLVYTIYRGVRNKNYVYVGSFISLLVFAGMSYPFSLLSFVIAFAFLSAACLYTTDAVQKENHPFRVIFLLLILLSGTLYCVYNRYPLKDAYTHWTNARMLYNTRQYENAVDEYGKVFSLLNHETQFLFEYAQSLSKTEEYIQSNKILNEAVRISCDPMFYNIMGSNFQAMEKYADAERCYLMAAHIVPHRLYPYYLLTLLYEEMGDSKRACEMADYLIKKEPKVHSIAVDEMKQEVAEICATNKLIIYE